jgi:hypothetical protein
MDVFPAGMGITSTNWIAMTDRPPRRILHRLGTTLVVAGMATGSLGQRGHQATGDFMLDRSVTIVATSSGVPAKRGFDQPQLSPELLEGKVLKTRLIFRQVLESLTTLGAPTVAARLIAP